VAGLPGPQPQGAGPVSDALQVFSRQDFQLCCGSGSGLDPDSMESLDLYPDSKSGSGSRRAKMAHQNRKKLINFIFSSAGFSVLRADGFSCSLDVLYGGLGIGKS